MLEAELCIQKLWPATCRRGDRSTKLSYTPLGVMLIMLEPSSASRKLWPATCRRGDRSTKLSYTPLGVMFITLEPNSHPETLACDLSPRRPLYQAKLHPAWCDAYHVWAELASRNFGTCITLSMDRRSTFCFWPTVMPGPSRSSSSRPRPVYNSVPFSRLRGASKNSRV